MRLLIRVFGVLLLASCSVALADEITFGNGEHLTGKLVSVHSGTVTFHSENLGLFQAPASKKLSLSVAGRVVVKTSGGAQYEGSLRPSTDSGWMLSTQDNTQLVSISPEEVTEIAAATPFEIASAEKQVVATQSRENVWEQAKDRPRLLGPWSVDSRLALSGVYSTKNRSLFHWNGELDRSTSFGGFKFTGERIYSVSTNQNGKSFNDDNLARGDGQFSKNLTQRSAWSLGFEGLHDEAKEIDKRLILSSDLNYRLFDGERVTITPFVGPAWIHYSYLPNKNVTASPIGFGAVQFGYTASFRLPGKLDVQHEFSFDQGYRGDGTYLSHATVRVRRAITKWLYLDSKITDDFDSKSAYRANPNTFRYSAGIGVTFDAF